MNIFQIPGLEENDDNLAQQKIIGIIDSSGSMDSNWPFLSRQWNLNIPKENTITFAFDTKTWPLDSTNILDSNINKYGGGGTNIYAAFQHFESLLTTIDKEVPLVVLFISDGSHNSGGNINELLKKLKGNTDGRKINFLCLGVGSGFPTFIAMELRKLYHNGDDSVPAIFLIEFITEKAYEIKFEALKSFFNFSKPRKVFPPVCLFPWCEYTEDVYEFSWVMSNDDKIKIDEDEVEISEFNLNIKGIQELFRSWAQMMQIDSLKEGQDITNRAKKTLVQMDEILEELKNVKKIDLLGISTNSNNDGKLTFKERAWNNYLSHNFERTKWFYDDVKKMAEGDNAKNVSAFEAAKKIGVGTIVGNYQQKIMNLKSVTLEKFKQIKENFSKVFINTKLSPINENSFFSPKKIFLQNDLLNGLEHCKWAYDIAESFFISGIPLRMVKTNIDEKNAWTLNIKYVSNSKDYVDSAMIFKNNGSWPVTEGEKSENVNAIVPILDDNDKDLVPLFKTELFKLVMTVNVLNNCDYIAEDAYEAVLIQTIIFLFEQEKLDDEKKYLIDKLLQSARIYLEEETSFTDLKTELQEDLLKGLLTNDLSKRFKSLLVLLLNPKVFELNHLEKFFTIMLFEKLKKTYEGDIFKVIKGQSFKGEEGKNKLSELENDVIFNFKNFFTNGDFKRYLQKAYSNSIDQTKIEFNIDIKEILDATILLRNLTNFCGVEFNLVQRIEEMIYLVRNTTVEEFAVLTEENKKNKISQGVESLVKEYKTNLENVNKKKNSSKNNPIFLTKVFLNLEKELKEKFIRYFRNIHKNIIPISDEELKLLNIAKKTKDKLYLNNVNLFRNACMGKNCSFYGKVFSNMKKLSHHMNIFGNTIPRQFHSTIKHFPEKSSKEIFEALFNGKYDQEFFGYTEEEVLEYIDTVQSAYKNL